MRDPRMNPVVQYIKAIDKQGEFHREVERIIETEYRGKPIFSPLPPWWFPSYSTAWGQRLVYLARNFWSEDITSKAGILIHEAVHCHQWEQGSAKFISEYVKGFLKAGYRNSPYEVEAYDRQNQFYTMVRNHRTPY